MFASAILAFLITVVLTVVIWVAVAIYRRRKPKLPYFVFFGCLLTLVLFIPGCMAVGWVVCAVAYGDYHYATAADMGSGLPLPTGARDITWYRYEVTQSYRFKVSESELRSWFEDYKNKFRDREAFSESGEVSERGEEAEIYFEMMKERFAHTRWPLPKGVRKIGAATFARNGAGISLWYSKDEGVAYCQTYSR